jgi:hypothetical protein
MPHPGSCGKERAHNGVSKENFYTPLDTGYFRHLTFAGPGLCTMIIIWLTYLSQQIPALHVASPWMRSGSLQYQKYPNFLDFNVIQCTHAWRFKVRLGSRSYKHCQSWSKWTTPPLFHPLGEWLKPLSQLWRKWPIYFDHSSGKLYICNTRRLKYRASTATTGSSAPKNTWQPCPQPLLGILSAERTHLFPLHCSHIRLSHFKIEVVISRWCITTITRTSRVEKTNE